MSDELKKTGKAKKRPKRIPLGTRNILTAPKRPGFVRRIVNDTEGRIERFKAAGYEHVIGDVPIGDPAAGSETHVGSPVRKSVGGGITAYLMEIPEEWYNEDQAEKQGRIDQAEKAMYTPKEGMYGGVTKD